MANSLIPLLPVFTDSSGNPVDGAYLFIGKPNTDPTLVANQIPLYSDENLSLPVSQPVRTNNGYAVDDIGNTIRIFPRTDDSGKASVRLNDSGGSLIYQVASISINTNLTSVGALNFREVEATGNLQVIMVPASGIQPLETIVDSNLLWNASTNTFEGANITGNSLNAQNAQNSVNAQNAVTQPVADVSVKIATTAFVDQKITNRIAAIQAFIDNATNSRWQTVTRTENTVYTNTTAFPLGFRVVVTYGNSCTLDAISDNWTCQSVSCTVNAYLGATVADTESGSFPASSSSGGPNPASTGTLTVEINVPPGQTYKWVASGESSALVQENRAP